MLSCSPGSRICHPRVDELYARVRKGTILSFYYLLKYLTEYLAENLKISEEDLHSNRLRFQKNLQGRAEASLETTKELPERKDCLAPSRDAWVTLTSIFSSSSFSYNYKLFRFLNSSIFLADVKHRLLVFVWESVK